MTDTFDFVVVGGGSGGCAVAGRLSEDPKTSVAVLDAGGKNDNWVVTTPFALALMVPARSTTGRSIRCRRRASTAASAISRAARGSAARPRSTPWSISAATAADYDQWASLGNPGWSFADVLPYFKRSEDNADFDGEYHGKGGPLAVNKLRTDNPVQQIFLQARAGRPVPPAARISTPTSTKASASTR